MAEAAGSSEQQHPPSPARHPMIPGLYVMPWRQDMRNRTLLVQNADLAGIPAARESFCKREHPAAPPSSAPLRRTFHRSSHLSRYNSSAVTSRRLYQT